MNNQAAQKLIIAAGVILVILLFIIFIISRFFSGTNQFSTNLTPTPVTNESTNGFGLGQNNQSGQFKNFVDRLPYTSPDFTIGYSKSLGKFFIQKKTPNADAALRKFLEENNLGDAFIDPENVIITDLPINEAIQQSEETPDHLKQDNNPDLPAFNFSQFSQVFTTIFTGGPTNEDINKAVDESNKEISQQETGQNQGGGGSSGGGGNTGIAICDNPPDLVTQGGVTLSPQAMNAFQAALAAAKSHGISFDVRSSYRNCQQQMDACQSICGQPINGCPGLCAPVGKSCHQYGEAVDVNNWSSSLPYLTSHGWQHPLPDSDPGHFSLIGGKCPSK